MILDCVPSNKGHLVLRSLIFTRLFGFPVGSVHEISILTRKSFLSQIIEINKQFLNDEEESENLKLSITESDLNDNNNKNIDINNFHIKIVDFGNSEYLNKTRNGSTYTRSYRPPENILNEYYNSKSDIWVIGCILYELFNRDLLFDLSDFQGSKIEKDRKHLSIMYSLLGKIPKEISMNSEFSEDLFDSKGRIIKNKEIEEINLKEKLNNRLELSDEDYNNLENLLYKMLEYDVNKRLSAKELLNHKWFNY